MTVKLVAQTTHPTMSPEEFIAYCARVSNTGNQANHETSPKLLSYLKKNQHWSPFEMASATLEITTTRDIARQILRHRSFSFQEFSQRYANPFEGELGMVVREARMQDQKNRQNSIKTNNSILEQVWVDMQVDVQRAAKLAYEWAIDAGVAKEQARAVLPEGMMQSRLYMSGTIRSWIHYTELRSEHGTQLEHTQIARDCAATLKEHYPSLF